MLLFVCWLTLDLLFGSIQQNFTALVKLYTSIYCVTSLSLSLEIQNLQTSHKKLYRKTSSCTVLLSASATFFPSIDNNTVRIYFFLFIAFLLSFVLSLEYIAHSHVQRAVHCDSTVNAVCDNMIYRRTTSGRILTVKPGQHSHLAINQPAAEHVY